MTITPSCPGTKYCEGCRCETCRERHNRMMRRYRKAKTAGKLQPLMRTDAGPTKAILEQWRADGLTWVQIKNMTGSDRTVLIRLFTEPKVSALVARRVAEAHAGYLEYGSPARAGLLDGTLTRWMMKCLAARGWSQEWLSEQLGFVKLGSRPGRVLARTEDAIRQVFDERHDSWGPSRLVAVRTWRTGHFPAECYEWDQDGLDPRPVPGSMRPELIAQALTFAPTVPQAKRLQIRDGLRTLGQWDTERCARTSMANWTEFMGYEPEDYSDLEIPHAEKRGIFCRRADHDHTVPAAWRPGAELTGRAHEGSS